MWVGSECVGNLDAVAGTSVGLTTTNANLLPSGLRYGADAGTPTSIVCRPVPSGLVATMAPLTSK